MNVVPPCEVEFVERAADYLENPSFMVRLADLVGVPVEGVFRLAPIQVSRAVSIALRRSLDIAVLTLPRTPPQTVDFENLQDRVWWAGYRHTAGAALTGGVGGVFGTLGLVVELPITTALMLRSMTAIALEYGEDVRQIDVRLECLSLFGLGGPSQADDQMDASYLALRASLGSLVKHASKFVAHSPTQEVVSSIKNGTAPALVKLLGRISQRFELSVSEKVLAQGIPLLGALGGATINVLFAEHFNAIARFHFGLRYLERRWGEETIQAIYHEAAARYRVHPPTLDKPEPHYDYRASRSVFAEGNKPR